MAAKKIKTAKRVERHPEKQRAEQWVVVWYVPEMEWTECDNWLSKRDATESAKRYAASGCTHIEIFYIPGSGKGAGNE